ncbi:hypothetical protein B0H10DRAFT_1035649 [Mycena sp. CBHHK59/15]|nr:hypothetical protein B0H10DRAFT_1035649 [Mycena sp. CBHHK59/15]
MLQFRTSRNPIPFFDLILSLVRTEIQSEFILYLVRVRSATEGTFSLHHFRIGFTVSTIHISPHANLILSVNFISPGFLGTAVLVATTVILPCWQTSCDLFSRFGTSIIGQIFAFLLRTDSFWHGGEI